MQRTINFIISEENDRQRLDQALVSLLPELSRSRIQKWIKSGDLLLNQQAATPKDKVHLGDSISGTLVEAPQAPPQPQDLPLNVVYEDKHLAVINKPAGLVVHPGAGNPDQTLLNALLYHFPKLQQLPRAGIVHRLDKETSGLMVVAKTQTAQLSLIKQLQERSVKRHYLALAVGEFISGGTVNANIGRSGNDRLKMAVTADGKTAVTHFHIQQRYTGLTLLECRLETGRTHQIRVHLAHIRHPLVGDPLYGGRHHIPKGLATVTRELVQDFPRQALHAFELGFKHPDSNKKIVFSAKLPDDMQQLINKLPIDNVGEDDNF